MKVEVAEGGDAFDANGPQIKVRQRVDSLPLPPLLSSSMHTPRMRESCVTYEWVVTHTHERIVTHEWILT